MDYHVSQSGRLDQILTELSGKNRSQVQKAIKGGVVLVNGKPAWKVGQKVNETMTISWDGDVAEAKPLNLQDTSEPLPKVEILEETDEYLLVDKPADVLAHPTMAQEPSTLAHWIAQTYPQIIGVGEYENRPGIVHRLDRHASGVMVIAKTQDMFDHLKQQFQDRLVKKFYTVLVQGVVEGDQDEITFPIDRGRDGKMASRPVVEKITLENVGNIQPGREARTSIEVVERFLHHTLLRVQIHTGRTHQIRVHMLAYNHPVVGDGLYFNNQYKSPMLNRLFLHAAELTFFDRNGSLITAVAPLPKELQAYLEQKL